MFDFTFEPEESVTVRALFDQISDLVEGMRATHEALVSEDTPLGKEGQKVVVLAGLYDTLGPLKKDAQFLMAICSGLAGAVTRAVSNKDRADAALIGWAPMLEGPIVELSKMCLNRLSQEVKTQTVLAERAKKGEFDA